MRRCLLALLTGIIALTAQAKETTIASPDGKLVVTVSDQSGKVFYQVSYNGQQVLMPSALGLHADIGDFTKELTFKDRENKEKILKLYKEWREEYKKAAKENFKELLKG